MTHPDGAWEYHATLIPNSEKKPLSHLDARQPERQSRELFHASMRNWVMANLQMAEVLKDKGYPYQFIYSKESGHVDRTRPAPILGPRPGMALAGLQTGGKLSPKPPGTGRAPSPRWSCGVLGANCACPPS